MCASGLVNLKHFFFNFFLKRVLRLFVYLVKLKTWWKVGMVEVKERGIVEETAN